MPPALDHAELQEGEAADHRDPVRVGGRRYSVLIPLEFTRGIAERCIRAWTADIRFPRARYEIILAAPIDYETGELELLGSMLGPGDRIERVARHHDIDLLAAAAEIARGEVLVMTEAHCIPEPDFLERCEQALDENPSWDGFSGRSIPLTHNLLSEIEAEMYAKDIAANLERHPWLKVLDQCFVVRRQAYESSGGIEPQFGHFAEHLLAARLYRSGAVIGHDPRPAVYHHYVGEIDELVEFARDFGRGRLAFAAGSDGDSCEDLFEAPDGWSARYGHDREVARRMVAMLVRDLPRAIRVAASRPAGFAPQRHLLVRDRVRWLARCAVPGSARLPTRRLGLSISALRLRTWLRLNRRSRARRAFLHLNDAAARLGEQEALDALTTDGRSGEFRAEPHRSEWTAAGAAVVPAVGFHRLERLDRTPFRWSTPEVLLALPGLPPGGTLEIEWSAIDAQGHELARFYLNESPIPRHQIDHAPDSTRIHAKGQQPISRLGWISGARSGGRDPRRLGLPVRRISWSGADGDADSFSRAGPGRGATSRPLRWRWRRPSTAAEPGADPLYLLHVTKCGGTSLRTTISNGFSAEEALSPTNHLYYARQIPDHREAIASRPAIAVGHFGLDLPAATPGRSWRILAVVREPLDRLHSLHGYQRQQGFIADSMGFERWTTETLRLQDCLTGFFTPGGMTSPERGLAAVSTAVAAAQPRASVALSSCAALGLFERFEDTLNLLCAASGALPPLKMPHLNPTLGGDRGEAPDGLAGPDGRELLTSERHLYEHAERIFERQLRELHAELGSPGEAAPDSSAARSRLRRLWFDRHAARTAPGELSQPIAWLPGDAFPGENLHDYEEHHGESLRWTGPGERTGLHLLVDTSRRWRVQIGLHPATPRDHVDLSRLTLNGREVEIELLENGSGGRRPWGSGCPTLEGSVEPPAAPAESAPFSRLELQAPVRRGRSEFRLLGLALTGIALSPQD